MLYMRILLLILLFHFSFQGVTQNLVLESENGKYGYKNNNNWIIQPEFEDAYYYLGMLYLSLGWSKKAENMLSKMQNLNPSKLDFPTLESLDKIDPEWVEINETVHKILRRCESFARKKRIF